MWAGSYHFGPPLHGGRPGHKGRATSTPAHDALPTLPRAAARLVQGPFPRTTLPAARSRPPNNPLTYRLPCLPDLTANLTTYLRTYPPNYLSTYAISTQRTQRKRDDVNLPTYLPTYRLTYLITYLPTYLPNYLPITQATQPTPHTHAMATVITIALARGQSHYHGDDNDRGQRLWPRPRSLSSPWPRAKGQGHSVFSFHSRMQHFPVQLTKGRQEKKTQVNLSEHPIAITMP